ncbi:hypothetical protein EON77_06500 [bacterium]|nr:MAG: hypothetical protein EON77_06500 [bacterium]
MHRRTQIATLALTALIVVPALSLAARTQRTTPATSPQLKAQISALGKSAKRLSAAQKGAVQSRLASGTQDVKIDMSAKSLFSSAATDQAAIITYFATQKLASMKVGLQIIDKPLPAFIKDLRFVGSLYEDTPIASVANDTADNMEKGPYDIEKAKKNVDVMITAIGRAADKSGTGAMYHFESGFNVGVTLMVSNLLEVDSLEMKKVGRDLLKSNMAEAGKIVAGAPSEVDADIKTAFTTYSQAKITDSDSASEAVDPLNKVYVGKLN